MPTFLKNTRSFVMKNRVKSALGVLALGAVAFFALGGGTMPVTPITAEAKVVEQAVVFSGSLESLERVSLAFEKGGVITSLPVREGQKVARGQVLAQISNGDLRASVVEAQARVAAEEARLAQLLRGARPEERAVSEQKIAGAQEALCDAIRDSYTQSDTALRVTIEPLFDNEESVNPQLSFLTSFSVESDLERGIREQKAALADGAALASASCNTLLLRKDEAKDSLASVIAFFDTIAYGLAVATPSPNFDTSDIDAARTSVSTMRTTLNAAVKTITSAESALATALRENDLTQASATVEDIALQQADVERERAGLLRAQAELSRTIITAPIAGVVTDIELELGEAAAANAEVIRMSSDGGFEIKAEVSEIDVVKLVVGQKATIEFDALPDKTFAGAVAQVDLAETKDGSLPKYTVTVALDETDEGSLRSGLTASVRITTGATAGPVVALPLYAIKDRAAGKGTVTVRAKDGTEEVREVTIGLVGFDAYAEILSGLSEGEQVVPAGPAPK